MLFHTRGIRYFGVLALCAFTHCSGEDLSRYDSSVLANEFPITTVLFGRVADRFGTPLSNVTVKLLGDKTYITHTDAEGYYRIEEVFIAHSKAMIGSGEAGGAIDDAAQPLNMVATYTLLFSHEPTKGLSSLATFRTQVALAATVYRTGNSYIVETLPASFNAVLVPYAHFRVQVITGQADTTAASIGAAGAAVEVRPNGGDALNFDTQIAARLTDGAGFAEFDASFRLAAVAGYRIVVLPFDLDPEADNGFEYDVVWQNTDLSPYSDFLNNPNANYALHDIVINLKDALANNQGPAIAFSEPPNNGQLDPNSPIRVQFSRPMDPSTIQYTLIGCYNACGGATDQRLLSQEIERTELTLVITPLADLSRLFNNFRFNITGQAQDGTGLNQNLNFTLSDENVPDSVVVPKLFLDQPRVDGSSSEHYAYAVDFAGIYVFDSSVMDATSYLGPLFSTTNGTIGPDLVSPVINNFIPLRWHAVQDATGYRIYGRNTDEMTSWVMLGDFNANGLALQDDGSISVTVLLPAGFDHYSDDPINTPFYGDTTVMLAVLPYYGNGNMPPLDPNALLILNDNYGPAIMPLAAGANFDAAATNFAGVRYDNLATIAFSEYLDPNLNPSLLTQLGIAPGVYLRSGRMGFEWIDWHATVHHTAWHLQLTAPWVSVSDLYIGDRLMNTTQDGTCLVTGIDLCDPTQTYVYCDNQLLIPNSYELLGPVREAAEPQRFLNWGAAIPSTEYYTDTFSDIVTFSVNHKWMLEQGTSQVLVQPILIDAVNNIVTLGQAVQDSFVFDGTAVFNNQPTRQLIAPTPANTVNATLSLDSVQGIAVGDSLHLLDTDPTFIESVRVQIVNALQNQVVVDAITYAHAATTSIAIYPATVLGADALAGDVNVTLENPNGVGNLGFSVGDLVIVGFGGPNPELAEVEAVVGAVLTLDSDPADNTTINQLAFDHNRFTQIRLAPGTTIVRGVKLILDTVDGMKPGVNVDITGDFGTQAYPICAIVNANIWLRRNDQLYQVSNADVVIPFTDSEIRPADTIQIVASDPADNAMRQNARILNGNGEVQ